MLCSLLLIMFMTSSLIAMQPGSKMAGPEAKSRLQPGGRDWFASPYFEEPDSDTDEVVTHPNTVASESRSLQSILEPLSPGNRVASKSIIIATQSAPGSPELQTRQMERWDVKELSLTGEVLREETVYQLHSYQNWGDDRTNKNPQGKPRKLQPNFVMTMWNEKGAESNKIFSTLASPTKIYREQRSESEERRFFDYTLHELYHGKRIFIDGPRERLMTAHDNIGEKDIEELEEFDKDNAVQGLSGLLDHVRTIQRFVSGHGIDTFGETSKGDTNRVKRTELESMFSLPEDVDLPDEILVSQVVHTSFPDETLLSERIIDLIDRWVKRIRVTYCEDTKGFEIRFRKVTSFNTRVKEFFGRFAEAKLGNSLENRRIGEISEHAKSSQKYAEEFKNLLGSGRAGETGENSLPGPLSPKLVEKLQTLLDAFVDFDKILSWGSPGFADRLIKESLDLDHPQEGGSPSLENGDVFLWQWNELQRLASEETKNEETGSKLLNKAGKWRDTQHLQKEVQLKTLGNMMKYLKEMLPEDFSRAMDDWRTGRAGSPTGRRKRLGSAPIVTGGR